MNAPEKVRQYDRAAQTVGNIVHLEHFNVVIPDQRLATLFYVVGLGGTRDPKWLELLAALRDGNVYARTQGKALEVVVGGSKSTKGDAELIEEAPR